MPASDKTALEAVMEADQERIRLEKLAEELVSLTDDESQEYLMEVKKIVDKSRKHTFNHHQIKFILGL